MLVDVLVVEHAQGISQLPQCVQCQTRVFMAHHTVRTFHKHLARTVYHHFGDAVLAEPVADAKLVQLVARGCVFENIVFHNVAFKIKAACTFQAAPSNAMVSMYILWVISVSDWTI